jgi:hypothetical protein
MARTKPHPSRREEPRGARFGSPGVTAVREPGDPFRKIAIRTREPRSGAVRAIEPTVRRRMVQVEVPAAPGTMASWVGSGGRTMGRRFRALNEERARRRRPAG